ncbi:dTDP-4-dehydrorhamnose 3,5-epimerase family protein [Streptomyces termitum]|uniref:dTDP-4-dehydrorhamnose 3,5-epimerase family protein n=1 Tax=Streptomyces termitum TaxID=67368 RepID=UPI0033B22A0C
MRVAPTAVPGAYVVTPDHLADDRGTFHESLRTDLLAEAIGRPFLPRQINYSVSHRNVLRGLHGVALPPGQAKYVSCVRGALRDVIVDLRTGSPAFGTHAVTELDAESGRCLFIPEGVAHGFLSLADDTCICYVVSTTYVPGTQINIDPLDPDLDLPWGFTEPPLISDRDAGAASLRETLAAGVLAEWRG